MVATGLCEVNRFTSVLLFAVACGITQIPCQSEEPVTIEVGTLSAEDGDGWILPQIYSFQQAYPHIDIRHFAIGAPSRDEIRIEDLKDLSLNVLGVRSDMGYEIGYLVEQDLLEPIDSFLPDRDFETTNFFPNTWDAVTYRGLKWGVPYLVSSVVFILDWDLFEEAGISTPPRTWQEVLEMLPKLTRDTDGDGEYDQWGFRLGMRGRHDTHMFFLWMTMVLQQQGWVMKEGRFDLSHPSLRVAYDFLRELRDSRGSRTDNRRFKNTAGDLTARYGMQIAPSYFLNPLMKQHNYRIAPWPTFGDPVITDERRHYLAICKSTPAKEAASWKFLKWVTRQNADHPDGAWTFHLSARKDLLDRVDVQHRIESWADGFDVMHQTKGWNVHHGDQIGGRFEAMSRLEEIVTRLFHDELSFEDAMSLAETECNSILRNFRKNPEPYSLYQTDSSLMIENATVQRICTQSEDIIRSFPWHPGSKRVLSEALAALPHDKRNLAELIDRYANHPLGLLAFDSLLESKEKPQRKEFCKVTYQRYPDTSVERLARHRELQEILLDPELEKEEPYVSGILSKNISDLSPIELVALADSFRDRKDFKRASIYYLGFWERFPDLTEQMRLRQKILSSLRNSESFLEAETLATSNRPGFTSGMIYRDLMDSSSTRKEEQGAENLIQGLRISCASAFQGEESLGQLTRLLNDAFDLKDFQDEDVESQIRLALYARGVLDLVIRLACHGDGKRVLQGDYDFKVKAKEDLAIGLADRALELACRVASVAPNTIPLVFDTLDSRIGLQHPIPGDIGVEKAYRRVLSEFPNASETPRFAIAHAKFLRDTDLDAALAVCEEIERRFPEEASAVDAREMRALWLFQSGQFTEAKGVLRLLEKEDRPGDRTIEVLTALCDYSLGDPKQAEEIALAFIHDHPDHELANQLRIWLVSNRVSEFRFPEANQLIQDFLSKDKPHSDDETLGRLGRTLLENPK